MSAKRRPVQRAGRRPGRRDRFGDDAEWRMERVHRSGGIIGHALQWKIKSSDASTRARAATGRRTLPPANPALAGADARPRLKPNRPTGAPRTPA
jgi:hypothetical protein